MVARVPHKLDTDWLERYQAEQLKIKTAYLAKLGGGGKPVGEGALTAEQQRELAILLRAGDYECHFGDSWLRFVLDSSNANHHCNHVISIAPTGLVRFIDGMAAAKRSVEEAGGR